MSCLKMRTAALSGVVLLIALGLLTFSFSATLGQEKAGNTWAWTKDNPKPVWWKWENDTRKPMRGGYIHSASSAYIGLMNPNHWPVLDWVSITNMYEGLVYIQGDYQPSFLWLAESVKYPDPITCVMTLRRGIKFHDGTDFNAETVKYVTDYIKDKYNGCWSRAWIEPVKSIDVVDEYTVKWHFKRPWAGFLGMMATVPGYMISQKALEGDVAMKAIGKVEKKLARAKKKLAGAQEAAAKGGAEAAKAKDELAKAQKSVSELEQEVAVLGAKAKDAKNVDQFPVGTGRYMLEEGRPGNFLKMKRNPNWWFGQSVGHPELPEPDGIIVFVIPDESVRLANLRAGKLDYMGLSPTQYVALKGDPNFRITSQIGNHMAGLNFNQAKGPCQDIRVRKAISHALDRQALIQGLMLGRGRAASCMYHETHWAHNPNLKPVKFDPELSKKLLAEAGYKDGLTITGYMGNANWQVNLTEAVKAMLQNVGITWKVDTMDAAASSDRLKNLEYDLGSGGWAYIKEPDMLATGLYHPDGGFNYGRNKNDKVLALIEAGKQELDIEKRKKIYWELEKVLYDNYEDVWLWWPIIDTARSSRLVGYDVEMHNIGGEAYWFTHPGFFKDGRRQ